jgi:F-type H+-transporting ATPase subunit alpha
MASFRELAAFAQFGSDLDKATQAQLNRGQHMQEILKQAQYSPATLESQVIIIFAGTNGYADAVPLPEMKRWESELVRHMETSHPEIGKEIADKKRLAPELESALRSALDAFTSTWQ